MLDVDALIAKGRAQLDTVQPVTQDVLLGDEVVGVRFWPLSGPDWRLLTAKHPARAEVTYDLRLGYDLDAVLADYPRVFLVQGDEVVNLVSVGEDGKQVSRFPDIVKVLSGPDIRNLAMAVWGLNDYDPGKRLVEAGKALKGGRRKKRSSPGSSA